MAIFRRHIHFIRDFYPTKVFDINFKSGCKRRIEKFDLNQWCRPKLNAHLVNDQFTVTYKTS